MNPDTHQAITAQRPTEPDFDAITPEQLAAYREAENRFRASEGARAILGAGDPGAAVGWERIDLPGRVLPVRVHRPVGAVAGPLPLVVHVHGGGFVGTAAQSDWVTSRLAARLPALVVSVEHRLLDHGTPLAAAVDDGWDALRHLVDHAAAWGADPGRVAVFGESCGGLICALAAVRARDAGLGLRAQVLVNPATDVSAAMFDHASVAEFGERPVRAMPSLRLIGRLAVPVGADGRTVSPLHAADLGGLAPALVVVPVLDAIADHGRRYAERLQEAGTQVRLSEYPDAGHAFLSLPGLVPQAVPAREEVVAFLRDALQSDR